MPDDIFLRECPYGSWLPGIAPGRKGVRAAAVDACANAGTGMLRQTDLPFREAVPFPGGSVGFRYPVAKAKEFVILTYAEAILRRKFPTRGTCGSGSAQ